MRRRVLHGSLPPCGGGTGRGVEHARPLFHSVCESVNEKNLAFGVSSPPLSLSLPHKGGGNVVAPLCPSLGSHSHAVPRCAHEPISARAACLNLVSPGSRRAPD